MSDDNKLIPLQSAEIIPGSAPGNRGSMPDTERALEIHAKARAVDAAADAICLLIKGGHVLLESERLDAAARKGWEDTNQRIAQLDAESRRALQDLEAKLAGAKEKTTRLQMVLDLVAAKGDSLPDTISSGLGKAIESLTKEL